MTCRHLGPATWPKTALLVASLLMLSSGAIASPGHLDINGGFERLVSPGVPVNWSLNGIPADDGLKVEATTVEEAFRGELAVRLTSLGEGTSTAMWEGEIGFPVLKMLHMGTSLFHYRAVSSELSGENLLFRLDLFDKAGETVSSLNFFPPKEHIGDGIWHAHAFNVSILESRTAVAMRISFSVNSNGGKGEGDWLIDELQIYDKPPRLIFESAKVENAVYEPGEEFEVDLRFGNEGGGFFYDLHSRLRASPGLKIVSNGEHSLGVVEPGIDYGFVWTLQAERQGIYELRIDSWSPGNESLHQPIILVVASGQISSPAGRSESPTATDSSDEIVLENSKLRLPFPKTADGFPLFGVQCWNGSWVTMGICSPIGHALYLTEGEERDLLLLVPTEYDLGYDETSAWLTLEGQVEDDDGVDWTFSYRFSLGSSDSSVNIGFAVEADSSRRILRVAGPRLLAGETTFGANRDHGLFPGLEYLLPGERSSGTDFADPPHNLRTVPHPLKITAPVMIVEKSGNAVGLHWDPLQIWDGEHSLPAARYISPNWIQNQSNSLMELFLPSVPEYVAENTDEASEPYRLEGPVRLTYDVFALSNTSLIDTFTWWLDASGLPDSPPMPRSYAETTDLCTRCYKDVCWVPGSKAWKHTHLDDPSWIFWDPMVAVALWHHSALTESESLRDEVREQVEEALDARGGYGADLDLSLHLGRLEKTLASWYNRVGSLADSQRDDGSWAFYPSAGKERMGEPGDTSSGWTASRARDLLKFGRITGDPEAIEAGMKAIEYLDTQGRPEGAQTWELQLHVPDVLGSSYVAECYLEAYRITGNVTLLERAKYWALTGLPFIYMWNTPDRPIMRYGSIPVFGASLFTHAWFGNIVQWNGLDYAHTLYELSRYDDSMPWRQISEGITICAMQMQRYPGGPHDDVLGMYPDAFSAPLGADPYYFDINPRFISLCVFALMGSDETSQTEIIEVEGQNIHISAVGGISDVVRTEGSLSFLNTYPEGDTSYVIVGCISRPSDVKVNGRSLPRVEDMEASDEGWQHRSEGMLAIKIVHSSEDRIVIEGADPQANARYSQITDWYYDHSAEGWENTNMLETFVIEDGLLKSRSTGNDPVMIGPSLRIPARESCRALINMSVSSGSRGQLFWIRKDARTYSEAKSVSFEIVSDGAFHEYVLDLGASPEWSGVIRQLRFDPTDAGDSEILLDYLFIPEHSPLPVILLFALGLPLHRRGERP